jgi:hypothetical protein
MTVVAGAGGKRRSYVHGEGVNIVYYAQRAGAIHPPAYPKYTASFFTATDSFYRSTPRYLKTRLNSRKNRKDTVNQGMAQFFCRRNCRFTQAKI